MPDSRVQKWQRWLENEIRPEVLSLHWYRMIYREVGEITEANPSLPASHFFTFVGETYAQAQAVAIRRQIETSTRVVTLGTLLREMADDSTRLTRRMYVAMYDENTRDLADPGFDELAGRRGADHIPAAVIEDELRRIRDTAQPISDYVDRHLAHRDRAPLPALPTFRDLHRAIDAIGDAFVKAAQILTASSWLTLEAVPQYDWLAVFRVPWIPPDQHRGLPPPRLRDA